MAAIAMIMSSAASSFRLNSKITSMSAINARKIRIPISMVMVGVSLFLLKIWLDFI